MNHDNAAALLAGLENPSEEAHAGLLAALYQRLAAPELRELRDVMLAWAAWQARRRLGLELEVADMAEAVRLEDYDDADAYFAARIQARQEELRAEGREAGRAEGRAEGREAGRVEGRVVGQRESMRRHAAMKFDAETAARLGAVLEGVTDQEVFDGVRMRHAVPSCSNERPRRGGDERAQPRGRLLNDAEPPRRSIPVCRSSSSRIRRVSSQLASWSAIQDHHHRSVRSSCTASVRNSRPSTEPAQHRHAGDARLWLRR